METVRYIIKGYYFMGLFNLYDVIGAAILSSMLTVFISLLTQVPLDAISNIIDVTVLTLGIGWFLWQQQSK